mmetsp:Transcript_24520/g.65462  ORF Transcript_24520/g.65462 Transcript_24520/m.65462 type:complete len:112 (-) Transcript_24520:160-495(-)
MMPKSPTIEQFTDLSWIQLEYVVSTLCVALIAAQIIRILPCHHPLRWNGWVVSSLAMNVCVSGHVDPTYVRVTFAPPPTCVGINESCVQIDGGGADSNKDSARGVSTIQHF